MTSRVAGGPADLATCVALVPWLCVTVFRRLCSEQRAWHFTTNGSFCSPFATQHCSNVGKRAQECNVAVQKVQELARRAGKGAAFWCKRPVSHLNRKGAWGQNGGPRLSFTSAMRRADPARRHPHFVGPSPRFDWSSRRGNGRPQHGLRCSSRCGDCISETGYEDAAEPRADRGRGQLPSGQALERRRWHRPAALSPYAGGAGVLLAAACPARRA